MKKRQNDAIKWKFEDVLDQINYLTLKYYTVSEDEDVRKKLDMFLLAADKMKINNLSEIIINSDGTFSEQ